MKECTKCGVSKNSSEFFRATKEKSGLKSRCKLCEKVDAQERIDRDPEHHKAMMLKSYHKRRIEVIAEDPSFFIWRRTKISAKNRGLDFNLEPSDIRIPAVCPVYGMPLVIADKRGDERIGPHLENVATIDRVDPARGYVKGNVQIVSFKANRLKSDCTPEHFRKMIANVEAHLAGKTPVGTKTKKEVQHAKNDES